MSKPLAGSLGHRISGENHLLFVPGIGHVIADPHVRSELLMLEWEGASPSSIPLPHGPSVLLSKKCADSPIGLAFTTSVIRAAVLANDEIRRALPEKQNASDLTKGQ